MMELLAFIESAVEFESSDCDRKLRTLDELGLSLPTSAWVGLASVAIAGAILTTTPKAEAAIHRGNSGYRVANVQQALAQKGFNPGTIDAVFGGATEYAVIKFQRQSGLTADGIVGTETSKALFGGSNVSSSSASTSTSAKNLVVTSTEGLNIRSGPGTNYAVTGSLANGAVVSTTGAYSNGWAKLSAGGWVSTTYTREGGGPVSAASTGYTSTSYASTSYSNSASARTVVVATNGSGLNIRSGPGQGYAVIGSLADGAAVGINGIPSNGWVQLSAGGWISANWIQ
jgi:peptidoglycan hydrolase-like protein with peptidoglycan-binding domain